MPSVRPTVVPTLRYTLAAAVVCLTAASGPARALAQLPPQGPQPIPKPPALQNFTLTDKSVTVDLSDGVKINTATVTMANVLASNGVIHVIDAVLVPE